MTNTANFKRMRLAILGSIAVFFTGQTVDVFWHTRNPGKFESAGEMLRVHSASYIGAGLMFIVATWAVSKFRPQQPGFVAIFVGGTLLVTGSGWDLYGHVAASHIAPAHALILIGLVVVVVGLPLLHGRCARATKALLRGARRRATREDADDPVTKTDTSEKRSRDQNFPME